MTNAPKHTPGPWTVEPRQWDHGASLAIVAPNSGYIVAVVPFDEDIQTVDEPDYDTVKRHPNDVPNAHLIAAAPAMYEALKDLLGELGDLHDGSISELQCHWCGRYYDDLPSGSLCPSDDCPGYKARAALAQAEGSKP